LDEEGQVTETSKPGKGHPSVTPKEGEKRKSNLKKKKIKSGKTQERRKAGGGEKMVEFPRGLETCN